MSHVVKVQGAHAAGGFILAAWLPQGIAEAMEPIRQGVSVLAHLHKRITLSPDNFKDEPLSIEDIELLKHIWADIPGAWPLAIFQIPRACGSHLWENFMRDDYARFGEAFAASALKPDWDVVPAFFDPVETGNSKRLEIRRAHWAELEKAAVDGRIKLFDDIGIPVTKMEIGTKISVADAREYLAGVPPGFVLEIIEPATRDKPILRHVDEVSMVQLPPHQWLLTDDVALAIAKAVHPLPVEADGHFETRLKHVLQDGRNQFVRGIKYVNPEYDGTYQGEAYLRHAAQLVAEVRSGSIAAISQSRTPVTQDVPGMMLKRADVLRYLERCGMGTAEANTFQAVEEADATPEEAPKSASKLDAPKGQQSREKPETVAFRNEVHRLMGVFWNQRAHGSSPTKAELHEQVHREMLKGSIRGRGGKLNVSMVKDASKSWKRPLEVPSNFDSYTPAGGRHPWKEGR